MISRNAIKLEAGHVLFREGDPGDYAWLIEEGEVEVSVQRDGEEVAVTRRGAGELVGEIAVIDGLPRSATVRAVCPCEVILVPGAHLRARIEAADPIVRLCLRVALDRIRTMLDNYRGAGSSWAGDRPSGDIGGQGEPAGLQELRLVRDLASAIDRDELCLNYQPIFDLARGNMVTLEALLRWNHATHGNIAPDQFIPAAEASGLICPLGSWVIDRALDTLVLLGEALPTSAPGISINISGAQLADDTIVDTFRRGIELRRLDPAKVRIEVTETVMIGDFERTAATLWALEELGLSIALDDFGTGYSSIAYLSELPIHVLKIDKRFVHRLGESRSARALIRGVIGLGEAMDIPVVAEGIETNSQLEILRSLGCAMGQGYLLSRPLPLAELLNRYCPAGIEQTLVETPVFERRNNWTPPKTSSAGRGREARVSGTTENSIAS